MNILVTGSSGFLGKNLCLILKQKGYQVLPFDRDTKETLPELMSQTDFVMHLAGINRPKDTSEFYKGNAGLTEQLIGLLKQQNKHIPLLISSSIQADLDNDYGKSKKEAEDTVFQYGRDTGSPVFVFRLENAFGKWSRPNYNSVVSTFCYNVANDIPLIIRDPKAEVTFVYVDDIVDAFISCIGKEGSTDYCHVKPAYPCTLGHLAEMIQSFRSSRDTLLVPDMSGELETKLYATYLSYLKEDEFSYPLVSHSDNRGSFTELVKSTDRGQVSINIIKPGITKGNHWHHTKNEKFIVVSGTCTIRFRKIGETEVISYTATGEHPEVVDIPTGYTHSIENTGDADAAVVMWCSEIFDPEHPDTFAEQV